jgi:hypothetical protein
MFAHMPSLEALHFHKNPQGSFPLLPALISMSVLYMQQNKNITLLASEHRNFAIQTIQTEEYMKYI